MVQAIVTAGIMAFFGGGLKLLSLWIKKLQGAQKFTATVAEYKKLNRQDYRMYLNISHEKAPEKIRLNEMVQFEKGKPELEIGEELSVYWIPGKKTAMRVAQPSDAVVSMLIGLLAVFIGFAISDAVQN